MEAGVESLQSMQQKMRELLNRGNIFIQDMRKYADLDSLASQVDEQKDEKKEGGNGNPDVL